MFFSSMGTSNQIAQIYKNAIEETKQYLKDKKLYIPTVNDYLLTGYNGTIF